MAHARAGKKYTINTAAGWRRLTSDGRGARSVGCECQCAGARGARGCRRSEARGEGSGREEGAQSSVGLIPWVCQWVFLFRSTYIYDVSRTRRTPSPLVARPVRRLPPLVPRAVRY